MKKIAVVGTGYVGLVSGTCFAEAGNNVCCIDIDVQKVDKLKSGQITIYEPGLEKLFKRNVSEGRLTFTTNLEEGIKGREIIFLALPTPPGEDGSADLKYILSVAAELGKLLNEDDFKVIVDKSTVPVGTADLVRKTIIENGASPDCFDIVSNPEFLREGVAVDDFMKPDRVVIGYSNEKSKTIMGELYAPFVRQGNPVYYMDERSAELTKYAANSFLATKITFINEIARLCEILGADVDMVRFGIGSDDRIGKRFLFPGIGYGGSCFPKDVKALVKSASDVDYNFEILKAVMNVNAEQKTILIPRILGYFDGNISGRTFAIWGLAFKPNTDDIREAPALEIIDDLLSKGANVVAYDPEAMENVKNLYGDKIKLSNNQYEALDGADALIIATEWNEFRTPDFDKMTSLLKNQAIFDGRNLYALDTMRKLNYYYSSIGREIIK